MGRTGQGYNCVTSEMASIIERFCTGFPKARVVVTSRIAGYSNGRLDPALFSAYRIIEFDHARVKQFVRHWFALTEPLHGSSAEQLATAFLRESEVVSELRSNPLMLSLLCLLYRGEGYIPRNRATIYGNCSNMLFDRWDRVRGIAAPLRIGRQPRCPSGGTSWDHHQIPCEQPWQPMKPSRLHVSFWTSAAVEPGH